MGDAFCLAIRTLQTRIDARNTAASSSATWADQKAGQTPRRRWEAQQVKVEDWQRGASATECSRPSTCTASRRAARAEKWCSTSRRSSRVVRRLPEPFASTIPGGPPSSGVVEAACKTLVTQRLKLSAMRWGRDGAQAVLTMRGWDQSDRFDEAWALVAATYEREVHVLANVVDITPKPPRAPRPKRPPAVTLDHWVLELDGARARSAEADRFDTKTDTGAPRVERLEVGHADGSFEPVGKVRSSSLAAVPTWRGRSSTTSNGATVSCRPNQGPTPCEPLPRGTDALLGAGAPRYDRREATDGRGRPSPRSGCKNVRLPWRWRRAGPHPLAALAAGFLCDEPTLVANACRAPSNEVDRSSATTARLPAASRRSGTRQRVPPASSAPRPSLDVPRVNVDALFATTRNAHDRGRSSAMYAGRRPDTGLRHYGGRAPEGAQPKDQHARNPHRRVEPPKIRN